MTIDTRKFRILYLFPFFLILYEFSINMSNDMYLPALPTISHEFGVGTSIIQLTITAWLIGSAAVQLVLGPVSDRHGRRPVIFLGGVIFLISTIICAITPYISILFIARFFQGMAVCSLMVAGYASIHELFEDRTAVHILSYMGAAAILAPLAGPILGGYILLYSSWRVIFILLFVISLVALMGLWIVMPESNINPDLEALQPKKLRKTYLKIFLNKSFITSALPTGLLYSGIIVWITASPFIIIDLFQVPEQHYGYTQIPVFGAYIVGAQSMKLLTKRLKIGTLGLIGITISTIGGLALVLMSIIESGSLWGVIVPMAIYSLGCGFANAPLTRITLCTTEEKMGATTAFFYLKLAALGALGSFVVSLIYTDRVLPVAILIALIIFTAWIVNFMRHVFISKERA